MSDDALAKQVVVRIRVEMAKRSLNTTDLAAKVGVSDMWVSRRLRGKTEIHLGDLERLARALNLKPDELLEPVA